MRTPPEVFAVRNEFVLRLFLMSALEPAEARAMLDRVVAESDAALAELREQVDKFDAAAPRGAPLPLGRVVAEYGVRSFQTLHEWAQWARQHIGPA
jgi:hypothetical protein